MKLHAWIGDPLSNRNGIALIEVAPGEVADIETMLAIVDGDSVGHFGVNASLIADERTTPEELTTWLKKQRNPKLQGSRLSAQFGFSNASALRAKQRYYKVFVNRD
jgi:hypothetical protein